MASQFYQITFAAIPDAVKVNVEVEDGSPIVGDRAVEKAAFEIADGEILKNGAAGGSEVREFLPLKRAHPENALTNPDFPGVYVWPAAGG
jgi:hypothetical protein